MSEGTVLGIVFGFGFGMPLLGTGIGVAVAAFMSRRQRE
jgi:DNA-binding IclR family transcriptional regulator